MPGQRKFVNKFNIEDGKCMKAYCFLFNERERINVRLRNSDSLQKEKIYLPVVCTCERISWVEST